MEMVQGYAYLLADHLAQWVQPMTAMPAKPQLVAIRGDTGTGEFAGTLVRIGAPGWDRTSNPCLRRAVLYPLSYGRFNTKARQPEQERRQSETERIPGFSQTVHRTA